MSEYKIIISGFGGQGVVLAGNVLAQAAVLAGKHVTGMVSYGVEVRGGTANSSIIISDEMIASPVIDKPDIVIALNQPSVDKYKDKVDNNGFLVVNTSLVKDVSDRKDITIIKIPASEIAHDLGNIRTANIVAIGNLLKKVKILPIDKVTDALDEVFISKQQLIEINKKALIRGVEFG